MTLAISPARHGRAARRLRRLAVRGPRCPDCAGPLVFGEGCHVCPVCGYSGCEAEIPSRR